MKIIVEESEVLGLIVGEILAETDPDFPMTIDSGISHSMSRRIKNIVAAALSPTPAFRNPTLQRHVDLIRQSPLLNHLFILPWEDIRVMDAEGTLHLYIEE